MTEDEAKEAIETQQQKQDEMRKEIADLKEKISNANNHIQKTRETIKA